MAYVGRKAFQGIAAGIGLVSEGISAHKAKKQTQQAQTAEGEIDTDRTLSEDNRSPLQGSQEEGVYLHERTAIDSLEEQWNLDEAQTELAHPSEDHANTPDQRDPPEAIDEAGLAHQFAEEHPAPTPYTPNEEAPTPRLSAPVVLPQRRPKNRERGFIRAYAQDLDEFGIDEAMFLEFLDTAEKACQGAKWLNAINLASIGTMFMPSVSAIAVSIAVQITTQVAIAVDGRRRSNTFFDKMNAEFFQPRGLFCLVMTWNPELSNALSTEVDLTSTISQATSRGGDATLGRLQHKFKSSNGKAYGNIFPEVAPLVFPQLDQLASDQRSENKLNKVKKQKEFVASYLDKRARAKFAADNPTSHLNQGQTPTFSSRYADPNHPASSGDPLALVTGGHVRLPSLRRASTGQPSSSNQPAPFGRSMGLRGIIGNVRGIRDTRNPEQMDPQDSGDLGRTQPQPPLQERRQLITPFTPLAKLREKKVLYLAIVNMPSEAEMNQATAAVAPVEA